VYPPIWLESLADPDKRWLKPFVAELKGHPHQWRYLSADPCRLHYDEQVVVFYSLYPLFYRLRPHLRGEYEHLRKADQKSAFRQLLRDNLELAPAIRSRVSQIKESWPRQPIIGVHARYTDRKVNLSSVHRQVRVLLKREPQAAIFLATDNRDVLNQFSATYPNVLAPERAYAPAGTPLHRTPGFLGAAERGVEALVDIYLLAATDYMVIDEGSTFSYLARLLSDAEPSRIHNVQRGWWLPERLRHQIWSTWSDARYLRKTVSYLRKAHSAQSQFSAMSGTQDR
jgi:hypothetical protein